MRIFKNKLIVGVLVIVLIGITTFFSFNIFFKNETANAVDNPIPHLTKPPRTTTTLPVPDLPQPEDSPTDPYEDVEVNQIGKIEIPKIGLDTPLFEGVWLTVLNVGPGHWPGTAEAGQFGNMVIAGHRVTHSKPFRHIDDLVEGDEIIVTSESGRYTYKVTGHQIVYPEDIWIVDQTPGYRITLFACHPPGSAAQRYVIYGELVDQ